MLSVKKKKIKKNYETVYIYKYSALSPVIMAIINIINERKFEKKIRSNIKKKKKNIVLSGGGAHCYARFFMNEIRNYKINNDISQRRLLRKIYIIKQTEIFF